jgi:hypothetical protein
MIKRGKPSKIGHVLEATPSIQLPNKDKCRQQATPNIQFPSKGKDRQQAMIKRK